MLMYKDLPGLQVVVHAIPSFPLLRNSPTLCYFQMVLHGSPPQPKRGEFGHLRPGPKICQAQLYYSRHLLEAYSGVRNEYTNATIYTYHHHSC